MSETSLERDLGQAHKLIREFEARTSVGPAPPTA
jgi:hypothetical protein